MRWSLAGALVVAFPIPTSFALAAVLPREIGNLPLLVALTVFITLITDASIAHARSRITLRFTGPPHAERNRSITMQLQLESNHPVALHIAPPRMDGLESTARHSPQCLDLRAGEPKTLRWEFRAPRRGSFQGHAPVVAVSGPLRLPWHGWQYRPENGEAPPPFKERLPTYRVQLSPEGRVLVHPEACAGGQAPPPLAPCASEAS